MNLAWMAALTIVFLAEKNWRHRPVPTRPVGIAVRGLGIAVLIHPALLAPIAFVHPQMMSG